MRIGMRALRPKTVAWLRDALLAARKTLPCSLRGQKRAADAGTLCVHIGMLAGFISSKRRPLPDHAKLWQGFNKLQALAQGRAADFAASPGSQSPRN